MRSRTANGKKVITVGVVMPGDAKRPEHFDPVLDKWSDPETISDKRLKKLICEAGGVHVCPRCESFDRCQYGRELVKRSKARQRALE